MLTKATLAAMATFWAPADAAELQSYTVTVLEQIRYDITVDANEESAARTLLYWKRAEPRDLLIRLGNLRRQRYWRMCVKPTTLL
jgi:hypothetical protein